MKKKYKIILFVLVTFLVVSCGSNKDSSKDSNNYDSSGMKILSSVVAPEVNYIAISPDGTKAYISTLLKYRKDVFDKEFEKPGLRVVDITNPQEPEIVDVITMKDEERDLETCYDIKISPDGKMLYSIWFRTLGDITYNLDEDIQINHEHDSLYSGGGSVVGISSNGKKIYTTAHSNGGSSGYIIVMDNSNKEKGLVDIGTLRLTNLESSSFTDLDISKDGKIAYLINRDDNGGLFIVDISDDKSPKLISNYKSLFRMKEIAVSSNDTIAYVGSYSHGVDILDISDKKKPKLLHHLSGTVEGAGEGGNQVLLSKDNTKLFVAGGTYLEAYDVHNPSAPKFLGKQLLYIEDVSPYGDHSRDIALSKDERKIYAGTKSGFFIVDISNL
jgi:hypothetical protein